MARTPWVGLAALIAMFAIPYLPPWLFEDRGRSSTGHAATSAAIAADPGPTGTPARLSARRLLPCMANFGG
jgi:hypothetical protein